jgi:gamma-glutamyltranspeptidase/glutathione hydrolase
MMENNTMTSSLLLKRFVSPLARPLLVALACGTFVVHVGHVGVGTQPGSALAAYREPLTSPAGAVAADHELASRAGAEILAQGGNAVDAAIATALALGVVQPAGSGLGGGGFLLVRLKDGSVRAIDFRETAPQRARPDMFVDPRTGKADPQLSRRGGLAIGVPGEAAGFAQALREYGKLTAAKVVAPALRLARDGFPAGRHLSRAAATVAPKLDADNPLRELLMPGGQPLVRGHLVRRPELAATLDLLGREGFAAFYREGPGTIGSQILDAVQKHGGVMSSADLRSYKPVVRTPLQGTYRDFRLYVIPPPAGGVTALEALQILNASPPLRDGPGSSSTLHEVIEAFKHAFADRARLLGDPAFVHIPTEELSSAEYARARAAQLQADHVLPAKSYGHPGGDKPLVAPGDHGTSHICVIDREGNTAALTTTINLSFGSHVVAGRTGIILNDQMDDFAAQATAPNAFGLVGEANNAVAAGKRPASSMTPLIAVGEDGTILCAGGSGGPTIVTGVVQTVMNVIDFHMSVEAAVDAPRIHAQFIPEVVLAEPEIPTDVLDGLRRRGHKVLVTPAPLETAVQAVLRRPATAPPAASGRPAEALTSTAPPASAQPLFSATSDPRKGGLPAAPGSEPAAPVAPPPAARRPAAASPAF